MRICLVYDCLFPHTVGGAERWYRNLAERLAADGHEVTYLTLRQWDRGADAGVPGVDVVAVGPRMQLYAGPGRRRILPPLVFGAGVLWHLLRHGRPLRRRPHGLVSVLLAARRGRGAAARGATGSSSTGTRSGRWRTGASTSGGLGGPDRLARPAAVPADPAAGVLLLAPARAPAARGGLSRRGHRARGRVRGVARAPRAACGRAARRVRRAAHPREARRRARAGARSRASEAPRPARRAASATAPSASAVKREIAAAGLNGAIDVPGFVDCRRRSTARSRGALCMVLPSRREGYGLVVVEAASHGTPSIVVADPDNAAVELIEEGVNGFVAASVAPDDLAAAIVRVARRRRGAAAAHAGVVRSATRSGCRSTTRSRRRRADLRAAVRVGGSRALGGDQSGSWLARSSSPSTTSRSAAWSAATPRSRRWPSATSSAAASYPYACRVRTPVGTVSPVTYSHHDVFTIHEIFGREDYRAGPELGVVVDIGSNIGISATVLPHSQPQLALLPVRAGAAQRRAPAKRTWPASRSRYELQQVAVAAGRRPVDFTLEPTGRYGGIGVPGGEQIQVQCRAISDVLDEVFERERPIDLLKIDTEGAELDTVRAIPERQLERIRTICFETHDAVTTPTPAHSRCSSPARRCRLDQRRRRQASARSRRAFRRRSPAR